MRKERKKEKKKKKKKKGKKIEQNATTLDLDKFSDLKLL
jgi:hypothetical protein